MKLPAVFLFGFLAVGLPAEVVFSSLDLDPQSRLLFAARNASATSDYQVWFRSDLAGGGPPQPLTFFPETATWLAGPGQLQIQNRFGIWRLDPGSATVTAVSPQVFGVDPGAGEGKSLPLAYSPDGRSVLLFKPQGVEGEIELRDLTSSASVRVSDAVDLSYQTFPALWSPDGQFFVYEKKGSLYYYSLRQWKEKRVPEENLRRLGSGLLSSAAWGAKGELFYVADQVLYRILPEEFFTRSLYRALFQTWGIVGKLPFPFSAATDRFWLAPDGRSALVNLGGRSLFYYPLDNQDFYQTTSLAALTYLPLPQAMAVKRVLWPRDNRITLLTTTLKSGKDESQVLRVTSTTVQPLDVGGGVVDLVLSPDESQVLVVRRDGVSVRDAATFAELRTFAVEGTVAAFWKDQGSLLVTGRSATVGIDVATSTVRTLLWGSMDQVGTVDGRLAGRQGSQWYLWQPPSTSQAGQWRPTGDLKLQEPQTASAAHRVFLADLPSGPWRNTILVRDLSALTTKPLLASPLKAYEPFPRAEGDLGDGISAPFRNGARLRLREVALAIDALDSSEGLPQVLRALKEWGFRATFFVNGEFLRRNPQAAREIAESGHETANLFHLPLDLTTAGFVIDSAFVRQGLARQEDDWFALTGKELGLLWHAPGWVEGPPLLEGARLANYRTIGTDLVELASPTRTGDVPRFIADVLAAKKPGSIVPLTLGMKDSKTGESFFNRWDLLLNGLAEAGYRVVTVSQLMDDSRP